MGAVRVGIASRFRVVSVKCATGGKMMMFSVILSIGLFKQQDDTEISIRAKTRTNERHDETSERGRNCEIQQTRPDDFMRSMST